VLDSWSSALHAPQIQSAIAPTLAPLFDLEVVESDRQEFSGRVGRSRRTGAARHHFIAPRKQCGAISPQNSLRQNAHRRLCDPNSGGIIGCLRFSRLSFPQKNSDVFVKLAYNWYSHTRPGAHSRGTNQISSTVSGAI
jgi:hypothetical protein